MLEEYEAYLAKKGLVKNTIGQYRRVAAQLLRFLPYAGIESMEEFRFEHLEAWEKSLRRKQLQDSSVKGAMLIVNNFLGFLLTTGYPVSLHLLTRGDE